MSKSGLLCTLHRQGQKDKWIFPKIQHTFAFFHAFFENYQDIKVKSDRMIQNEMLFWPLSKWTGKDVSALSASLAFILISVLISTELWCKKKFCFLELEHNLFKNISKWVTFLWQTQIQTIKYDLNAAKRIKKKQVTLILYSFTPSDMIIQTFLLPKVISALKNHKKLLT